MIDIKQAKTLLQAAGNFQAESQIARQVARDEFIKNETNEENILRIIMDGLLSLLAIQLSEVIDKTNDSISYQIGLATSFIRTHHLTMDHILNGDLIEATTLSRKQLENLTRMFELDTKPLNKLAGKVPNISNCFNKETGKLYGQMSEVAHFAKPRVTELLHIMENGSMIGPSIHPMYNIQSHACSDMEYFSAVYFAVWLVEKLIEWYPVKDFSVEKQMIGEAILLALECGVIRTPEEKII